MRTNPKKRPPPRVAATLVALAAQLVAPCAPGAGATGPMGWGALTGRIVVDGEVTPPAPVGPGRDGCCVAAAPLDGRYAIGPRGGLAGVVVGLRVERRRRPPADPSTPAPGEVSLTNRGCAFVPRVLLARAGGTLVLSNDDPTAHNVNIDFLRNGALNLVVPPGDRRRVALDAAEPVPAAVACNIHPFMRAWIVVRDDAYAAQTDEGGAFRIPRLPAGEWEFELWHEAADLSRLAVHNSRTDQRGRVRLTIPDGGELDLGEVRVDAARLPR